jgi:hypothetical protein
VVIVEPSQNARDFNLVSRTCNAFLLFSKAGGGVATWTSTSSILIAFSMNAVVLSADRGGHLGGKLLSLWGVSFGDSLAFVVEGGGVSACKPSTGYDLDMRILITGAPHRHFEQERGRCLARNQVMRHAIGTLHTVRTSLGVVAILERGSPWETNLGATRQKDHGESL